MRGRLVLVLCCVGGVVVMLGAAALGGFLPVPGSASAARPPCHALPDGGEVAAALEAHPHVSDGLRSVATGARIAAATPCDGEFADRALVRVTVASDDDRDAVSDWLGDHDGYGVPIEVDIG